MAQERVSNLFANDFIIGCSFAFSECITVKNENGNLQHVLISENKDFVS